MDLGAGGVGVCARETKLFLFEFYKIVFIDYRKL
jgi:hypothetical protein